MQARGARIARRTSLPTRTRGAYGAQMQFRVLGPLEVTGEDGPITLGGPRQRAVLAHLIVRANKLVPADALIDEVWGDEPPDAARNVLQTYVSHLRKALGRDRVEGRAPGYVLHLEPHELDAARFELLLQEAKDADGRSDRAATLLKEALSLWRGPAYGDLVAITSLSAEVARLDELRLQAREERFDAEIASGRQGEVIGELESLTRELPLRERLWELLMLALYRSGRPADALAAYQRARDTLSTELGVDPSPELQRLYQRILRQDPELELKGEPLRGYRLLEQIGEGAFGAVYRATQPQVGRDVAIKVVHPELANHPDFVRRFEREAQIVARLEHPHIVPLYDYWREPDGAYLVMRFLRGGSLEELLEAQGPLDPHRAATILDHVAAALAAAHRNDVVHRDVKPGNVLLDEEGNAYLTDFGVALDAGAPDRTSGTMMRGTPAYLSPEQILLQPTSPRSDIYALGVVLYEVLTGDHPFPESSLTELLERHQHELLPSVRSFRPELPHAVDDVISRATAKDPQARFADAQEVATAFRAAIDAPATVAIPSEVRNPYKGLRAFLEIDADDFYGREPVTERLLSRLAEHSEGYRFLAVVGPSGSGKSSVVRAGLVPALRRGTIPGSERWYVIEMLPGARPFVELESALLGVAVDPPPSLMEELERDELGLVRAVERVLPEPDAELVIVVDQLEEIFTLVTDDLERDRVLEALRAAALEPGSRIRIVATLRADFFDEPLSVSGFGDLLAARTEAITPMSPEELERAIVAPAERSGLAVEPRLLAAVISDVAGRPGALPLLQYALTELAERHENGVLTLEAYRQIDGVAGALARRAEQLFEAFHEDARVVCRQLFLRLVTLGEGSEDTRRRVGRSELLPLGDPLVMDGVVGSYGRHRLLSFDRDPATREPTVEIAHEALLGAWARLRGWIDEARDDIRTQRRLSAAAVDWEMGGRDPSFLLRGARLEQHAAWAESTTLALGETDHAYLETSLRQRDEERAEEGSRLAKERALERRSVRRMRGLVAVLAAAALVAGSLTVIARNQSERAERQSRVATARELAAASVASLDEDAQRSLLLAIQAVETTRSFDGTVLPEAEEALHHAVQADRLVLSIGSSTSAVVRYSPDGSRLLVPGLEPATANVHDASTGEILLTISGHGTDFSHMNYSPDGRFISTSSRTAASTKVWDAETGEEVFEFTLPSGEPVCCWAEFSPDGSILASNTFEGTVELWDLSTGQPIGGVDFGGALAFSPDGSRLWIDNCVSEVDRADGGPDAFCVPLGRDEFVTDVSWPLGSSRVATSISSGTVILWDAATGDEVMTLVPAAGDIRDIELARGGNRLAMGLGDGTARIWDLSETGGHEAFVLAGHDAGIQSMKFHPEGRRLATASEDGMVKVWDITLEAGGEAQTRPSSGTVAYGGAEDLLAVADTDGSVRTFDATGDLVRSLRRDDEPVWEIATDPTGTQLASASDDGSVTVWDLDTGTPVLTVLARAPVMDMALSSDAGLLATLSDNQTAKVWNATTGELVHTVRGIYNAIAFNGDGSQFAAPFDPGYTGEGRILVWDTDSWARLHELNAPLFTSDLMFSSNADLLVMGGVDGIVRVVDTNTWRVRPMTGNLGRIWGVTSDADGRSVATASEGGLHVWDVGTGRVRFVLSDVPYPPGAGVELAFSADGSRLAAPTPDGAATVYLLDIDDLLDVARDSVTRGFTEQECRQYLHVQTCPG
jgi:serine/threonine protein kinase/WD40 repeat protein